MSNLGGPVWAALESLERNIEMRTPLVLEGSLEDIKDENEIRERRGCVRGGRCLSK